MADGREKASINEWSPVPFQRVMARYQIGMTSLVATTVLAMALIACGLGDSSDDASEATPEKPTPRGESPTVEPPEPIAPPQPVAAPQPATQPAAVPQGTPGTVQAGSNPTGGQRRGIVRSAPNFRANELVRLNNGTAITILRREHGGWLFIAYQGGQGYLHKDVVSEGGMPSEVQNPTCQCSLGQSYFGPCGRTGCQPGYACNENNGQCYCQCR